MNKFEKFIKKSVDKILEQSSYGCLQSIGEDLGLCVSTIIIKEIKKAIKTAEEEKVIEIYERYCIDC